MSNKDTLIKKDTLSKIEEKRKILTDMLIKKNVDLKDKKVLEISKELDALITKYINEIKKSHKKK